MGTMLCKSPPTSRHPLDTPLIKLSTIYLANASNDHRLKYLTSLIYSNYIRQFEVSRIPLFTNRHIPVSTSIKMFAKGSSLRWRDSWIEKQGNPFRKVERFYLRHHDPSDWLGQVKVGQENQGTLDTDTSLQQFFPDVLSRSSATSGRFGSFSRSHTSVRLLIQQKHSPYCSFRTLLFN